MSINYKLPIILILIALGGSLSVISSSNMSALEKCETRYTTEMCHHMLR